MFNKKHIFVLLLLIIGICAISSVGAADNGTDIVASDNAAADDVVSAIDENGSDVAADDVVTASDEKESDDVVAASDEKESGESQNALASGEDDSKLAQEESSDVVSSNYVYYDIDLQSTYDISAKNGGKITYKLTNDLMYYNNYNYYFAVFAGYDSKTLKLVYKSGDYSTYMKSGDRTHTFKAGDLLPGVYTLYAVDKDQTEFLDSAILRVSGTAVITPTSGDYSAYYGSDTKMTAKVTDKDTGKALMYVGVKAVFSNGKTSVTKSYTTDGDGYVSFIPPVGVGTWTVTLSSDFDHIGAASVSKNVVFKKSKVKIKAYKVKTYQGYKITLKAKVTSQGKNVKEGTVKFRIKGKNYYAKVKNGIATKKVKLSKKVRSYKYSAKFYKSKNFYNSKTVKSTAKVKKRYATKLIVKKHIYAYRSLNAKKFYVTVKTKSGKIVKSGKVKILDAVKVNKKGKAKFYTSLNWNYLGSGYYTHYFKKSVTKTLKVKYIPASKKYKASTTKIKITMLYRCTACGSTTSHYHGLIRYLVYK